MGVEIYKEMPLDEVRKQRAEMELGVIGPEVMEDIQTLKADAVEQLETIAVTREVIRKLIPIDELTPEELMELRGIYDPFKVPKAYVTGDIIRYEDKLYKVVQDHTSQDNWTPDAVPALYTPIEPEGVIPEWKKPTGEHDAYMKGDQILFEGEVYRSLIDSNTWSPTEYPAGWEAV